MPASALPPTARQFTVSVVPRPPSRLTVSVTFWPSSPEYTGASKRMLEPPKSLSTIVKIFTAAGPSCSPPSGCGSLSWIVKVSAPSAMTSFGDDQRDQLRSHARPEGEGAGHRQEVDAGDGRAADGLVVHRDRARAVGEGGAVVDRGADDQAAHEPGAVEVGGGELGSGRGGQREQRQGHHSDADCRHGPPGVATSAALSTSGGAVVPRLSPGRPHPLAAAPR